MQRCPLWRTAAVCAWIVGILFVDRGLSTVKGCGKRYIDMPNVAWAKPKGMYTQNRVLLRTSCEACAGC